MSLTEELLSPIAGENPSGSNLRYDPIYDKIKEARRQEEDLAQGIWARDVKKADYAQVVKLATETLAKRSKDLQIAAWLTEALTYEDGIAGLREGVDLLHGLLAQYWDTIHPELEDGDAFMRTGILDWVGSHLEDAVKRSPLTARGFDWFDYKESRRIGYEANCADDSDKLEARNAAIQEGKITAEEFDEAFNATPKDFYTELKAEIDQCLEALRSLENLTDEKFTEEPPTFGGVRSALEEVQQSAHMLLARKREQEPDEPAAAAVEPAREPEHATEPEPEPAVGYEDKAVVTRAAAKPKGAVSAEPADKDDAVDRIVRAAAFLREQEPYSPVPYLVLRGLRWGELRAAGTVDPSLLESPPSEIRQQLKRQALDGVWEEVLKIAESAMGMPCGRGWLDVQRYVVRACQELGSWYDPIARSVTAEVRCLLADFPDLPEVTMLDDTPAANRETVEWLKEIAVPETNSRPSPEAYMPREVHETDGSPGEDTPPDAQELAQEALNRGRANEAMMILAREISQVKNGRERFQRRVQLSQICLAAGKPLIAFPILQDLSAEIEKRRLEEWESSDVLAHPLVLLHRCMSMLERSQEEKRPVYERICRLDPVQAMSCE